MTNMFVRMYDLYMFIRVDITFWYVKANDCLSTSEKGNELDKVNWFVYLISRNIFEPHKQFLLPETFNNLFYPFFVQFYFMKWDASVSALAIHTNSTQGREIMVTVSWLIFPAGSHLV